MAALWAGLDQGLIDTVCTDHAPWSLAAKLDPQLSIERLRPGVENLQLLLDGEATPSAIAAALEKVVATAQPHDTIVFSFAGHGVKGDDGHYYLTPAGYNSDDPKGTGLSWTQIASILGRAKE